MLSIYRLYIKYIKGTSKGDLSPQIQGFVCNLKNPLKKKLNLQSSKVYIKARALKHIYERIYLDANKPEVFETVLRKIPHVVANPEKIYKNKIGSKRGAYCFVKSINNKTILCVVETRDGFLFVVTSFVPKKNYLAKFEELE